MSRTPTLLAILALALPLVSGCNGDGRGDPFAGCGDGIRDRGEQCDDGNRFDNDDCLSTCVIAICGDGFVNQRDEDCDGANLLGRTCASLGFASGTLQCSQLCAFDTSGCIAPSTPTRTATATATDTVVPSTPTVTRTGVIDTPTPTSTQAPPTATEVPRCEQAIVTVALVYDVNDVPQLSGVVIDLDYPSTVDLPGSAGNPSVIDRVTDLSGAEGFFQLDDRDTDSDAIDDQLRNAYVTSTNIAPGDFERVAFDCAGQAAAAALPSEEDFRCLVAETSDPFGGQPEGVSCEVSVELVLQVPPTPTVTASFTSTATATVTRTLTATATPTSTVTQTATATVTSTNTLTVTATAGATTTSTTTRTPSATQTLSATPTETATETATSSQTPTDTPTAIAGCTTTSVVVTLAYDSNEVPQLTGVVVDLNYPWDTVAIPGSGSDNVVLDRFTDLSGAEGFFQLDDRDTNEDAIDDQLRNAYATTSTIPPGDFERVVFDCIPGTIPPLADDFGCIVAQTSDASGFPVEGVACTVQLEAAATPTPTDTAEPMATATPEPTATQTPQSTATATNTATETATPAAAETATSTASPTPTPTATETPAAAVCGNGVQESGETCDDGNAIDGDSCPSDCIIHICTPAGTTRVVSVSFAVPEGANVGSLTVLLEYPDGTVQIPGSGGDPSVGARITNRPSGFLVDGVDLNYALRVAVAGSRALAPGLLFRVNFDDCQEVPAPGPEDFGCTVEDAFDTSFDPLGAVTCSVSLS